MSLTRRRSGLKKTVAYEEPESPKGSILGTATTVGSLGIQGAQIHDTTMKTRLIDSGLLEKTTANVETADISHKIFEHTPTKKGELGWGRDVPDRTQFNSEVIDNLKAFEDANMIDDPTGSGQIMDPKAAIDETMNPSNWEGYLKDAGFNETEIAKEFGYDSADAFANAKTTGKVEMKLSDGSAYEFKGDYYEVDPAITEQAGQVQQDAMGQFKEFIHGPSGMEGWTPPGTEATISTVGETALNTTGELVQTTAHGTQLVSGSKVMTLANGNTVPLAGQALASETAKIAAVKTGADATTVASAGAGAKVTAGAKVFGNVAAAHSSAAAAGATAAEIAAAGAAAITPVGWTLIAIAIVATLVEADKHQKKKKKKKSKSEQAVASSGGSTVGSGGGRRVATRRPLDEEDERRFSY